MVKRKVYLNGKNKSLYSITNYIDFISGHLYIRKKTLFDLPLDDLLKIDGRLKMWKNIMTKYEIDSVDSLQKIIILARKMSIIVKNVSLLYTVHLKRQKGLAYFSKEISNNQENIESLEDIRLIPSPFFYSIYDPRLKQIYSFDIRHFSQLSGMNPYNREAFSENQLKQITERLNILQRGGYQIEFKTESRKLSRKEKIHQSVVHLFSEIDTLGAYTSIRWFYTLNKETLLLWYEATERIWSFRAQLPETKKERIVPGYKEILFVKEKVPSIYTAKTLETFQELVLEEMTMIVMSGVTQYDRINGAYIVLAGLVRCCREAALALPWLLDGI